MQHKEYTKNLEKIQFVDFKQIDKMALDLGMDYTNCQRISNGIKYGLTIITNNGHTCVEKQNLMMFMLELLKISEDLIESEFINLRAKSSIVIEKRDDIEWVYLQEYYKAEQNISERLLLLNKAKKLKENDLTDEALADIEENVSILKKSEANVVKLLNRYCSKLGN